MTIWIANTTRQTMQIHVRLPEMGRLYVRNISSGKQDEIRDLSPDQEDKFIRHLMLYGGKKRSELHGTMRGFSGMCYSTDKPFNMDEFHYGLEEVLDAADSRSVTEATKSALAADMAMRGPDGERLSVSTEIEMVEDRPQKGKKAKAMRITVDPSIANSDQVPLQ